MFCPAHSIQYTSGLKGFFLCCQVRFENGSGYLGQKIYTPNELWIKKLGGNDDCGACEKGVEERIGGCWHSTGSG